MTQAKEKKDEKAKAAKTKKPAKKAEKKPVKKPAQPKAQKIKKPAKKEEPQKEKTAPVEAAGEEPAKEESKKAEAKKPGKAKPKPKQPKPVAKIQYLGEGSLKKSLKKKPAFNHPEASKITRVPKSWRTCRGIDSKKAQYKRGRGAVPAAGYGKPKDEAGIVKGFRPVWVENVSPLASVDTKTQAIIISARLGRRKRNIIIEEANKLKIHVLNPRKGEI